jgi:hypothetical protein
MLWLVKQQSTPANTRPIPQLLLGHHTVDADDDTLLVAVADPDDTATYGCQRRGDAFSTVQQSTQTTRTSRQANVARTGYFCSNTTVTSKQ